MIIVICDVCRHLAIPPVESMSVGGQVFDVCGPCQDMPFKVPAPSHAMVMLSPGAGVEVYARQLEHTEEKPEPKQTTPGEGSQP